MEIKKYTFWWLVSNLPAILWVTWINAYGPVDPLTAGLGVNIGLWLGWLIFVAGIKRENKCQ